MPRTLSDKRRLRHCLRWAQVVPLVFHTPPFRWRREKPRGRGEGSARRGSLSNLVGEGAQRACHFFAPPGPQRLSLFALSETAREAASFPLTLCATTPGPEATPAAAAPGENALRLDAEPEEAR